ncbi:unnamed protein product [Lampetra planeri]
MVTEPLSPTAQCRGASIGSPGVTGQADLAAVCPLPTPRWGRGGTGHERHLLSSCLSMPWRPRALRPINSEEVGRSSRGRRDARSDGKGRTRERSVHSTFLRGLLPTTRDALPFKGTRAEWSCEPHGGTGSTGVALRWLSSATSPVSFARRTRSPSDASSSLLRIFIAAPRISTLVRGERERGNYGEEAPIGGERDHAAAAAAAEATRSDPHDLPSPCPNIWPEVFPTVTNNAVPNDIKPSLNSLSRSLTPSCPSRRGEGAVARTAL